MKNYVKYWCFMIVIGLTIYLITTPITINLLNIFGVGMVIALFGAPFAVVLSRLANDKESPPTPPVITTPPPAPQIKSIKKNQPENNNDWEDA